MGAAQVLCLEKSIPGASQKLEALGFVLGGLWCWELSAWGLELWFFCSVNRGKWWKNPKSAYAQRRLKKKP